MTRLAHYSLAIAMVLALAGCAAADQIVQPLVDGPTEVLVDGRVMIAAPSVYPLTRSDKMAPPDGHPVAMVDQWFYVPGEDVGFAAFHDEDGGRCIATRSPISTEREGWASGASSCTVGDDLPEDLAVMLGGHRTIAYGHLPAAVTTATVGDQVKTVNGGIVYFNEIDCAVDCRVRFWDEVGKEVDVVR